MGGSAYLASVPIADKIKEWKLYSYACSYLNVQKVTTKSNNKYDIFNRIDKRYKCASVCAQMRERVSLHLPLGFICVGAAPTIRASQPATCSHKAPPPGGD